VDAEPVESPGRRAAAIAWWRSLRQRISRSAAGVLYRRAIEVDLMNQALILAALAFTLLVPAFVTLAATIPLGGPHGSGDEWARRLGLSAEAARALQSLLPDRATVSATSTAVGVALTVGSAYAWPKAVQRAFELVWGLSPLRRRVLWRRLLWLTTVAVVGTLSGASEPLVTGWPRLVLIALLGAPLFTAWTWWSQHLLLGGRVPWRRLLPAAVVSGTGLVVLRLAAAAFLSPALTSQVQQYGALGAALVLLTWLVFAETVLLTGPLLGVLLEERRSARGG
jgi:membrane protein